MTHAQQVEDYKLREQDKENHKSWPGNYDYSQQKSAGGNRSQSKQKFLDTTPSSATIPSTKNSFDQKIIGPRSMSQGSASGTKTYPTCPKCSKNLPGKCLAGQEGCFGCGKSCHMLMDCPSRQGQGGGNGRAQSTTSAASASCAAQQGNSSGTGGGQRQNRLYALQGCQDQEGSPDVVSGT